MLLLAPLLLVATSQLAPTASPEPTTEKGVLVATVAESTAVPPRLEGWIVRDFGSGRKKEKFFSSTNIFLGAGIFSSAGWEMGTTDILLDLPESVTIDELLPDGRIQRTSYRRGETNGFMRPFVMNKTVGWSVKMGENAGIWIISYHLRRSDKKFLRFAGWVAPILTIGVQSYLAYRNYERYIEYRDICRRNQQMPPINSSGISLSIPIKW